MKSPKLILSFLFIIFSLSACTSTTLQLSAGNDEDSDIGLGGTGLLAKNDEDYDKGIGGTGILGKITGFGSIFVNGIEIEFDNTTPFTIDGNTAEIQQLQIGDIVEVLTVNTNQHTWARKINLRHEVIGKVESSDAKTYSFKVNGQTIVQQINQGQLPEIGTMVAVSGFRVNEKTIISSRVTPASTNNSLLRTSSELPFKENTNNWVIQMHVHDDVVFKLNKTSHTFTIKEENQEPDSLLKVRILKLHKPQSGLLKLDNVIKPLDLPRGQPSLTPQNLRGQNTLQKPATGEGFNLWRRTRSGSGSTQKNNQSGNRNKP